MVILTKTLDALFFTIINFLKTFLIYFIGLFIYLVLQYFHIGVIESFAWSSFTIIFIYLIRYRELLKKNDELKIIRFFTGLATWCIIPVLIPMTNISISILNIVFLIVSLIINLVFVSTAHVLFIALLFTRHQELFSIYKKEHFQFEGYDYYLTHYYLTEGLAIHTRSFSVKQDKQTKLMLDSIRKKKVD